MAVTKLIEAEYEEKVVSEENIVLIDFWREGCGPCKALSEELEALSSEQPELKIFSVNVEEEKELAQKLRVMAAPTLLVIKNGTVKKKSLGFKSKDHIIEMIEAVTGQ